jgi:hypothetical protein
MTPSQSHIPPHLREHIFRSYEDLLARAVSAWPEPTSFTVPVNVASATFVANLRNAIVSLKRHKWDTSIDLQKLLAIENPRQFVINFDSTENKVWFRQPPKKESRSFSSTVGTRVEQAQTISGKDAFSLVPWRDWTEAELEALCLLIDKQRITGQFVLDGAVAQHSIDQLQLIYNIAIVYDAERKQTVVT